MSKLDVTDVYHRGTIKLLQVGAFVYVIPSAPEDEGHITCIDLVLTIGWADSPEFLCAFSKILIDVANALVDTDLLVPSYCAISEIPATGPGPRHTLESLTHIYFYIDDFISEVQGQPYRQH